jgi:hypothetical protein
MFVLSSSAPREQETHSRSGLSSTLTVSPSSMPCRRERSLLLATLVLPLVWLVLLLMAIGWVLFYVPLNFVWTALESQKGRPTSRSERLGLPPSSPRPRTKSAPGCTGRSA